MITDGRVIPHRCARDEVVPSMNVAASWVAAAKVRIIRCDRGFALSVGSVRLKGDNKRFYVNFLRLADAIAKCDQLV